MGEFSYQELGGKLRAIRKSKNISLAEAAEKLNKSVSTTAKYETGEIAIDIESLMILCRYYQVNCSYVLSNMEFESAMKQDHRYGSQMTERAYVYYYHTYDKHIHKCVLENDNTTFQSILYFGVEDEEKPYECKYVYEGTVRYTDSHTYYVYYNMAKPFDMITINLSSLQKENGYHTGLLSSITIYYQNMAGKVLVSEEPVRDIQFLKDNLILSKDTIKEIRKTNFLLI